MHNRIDNRWHLLVCAVLLVLLLNGCGAKKPEVYHVGILSGLDFVANITDGFKDGMTEQGFVEGENIVYDVQQTDFDMAAYKSILQKFVADKVDLILVFPTEASLEAKAATQGTDIPVVFTFALIEGMGLVDSVRQPGGNITGVRYPGPDIALRRFEILHELLPEATRFLVPYQRGYPIVAPQLDILRPAAQAAGVTLIEAPADDAAELESILQAGATAAGTTAAAGTAAGADPGFDAILMIVEPLAVTQDAFDVMARFAAGYEMPIGGALMESGDYGSIFGVNVDPIVSGRQAAPLSARVLQGTPAGTIPVVSAENYFQIDYTMAQKLGVMVPEGLLAQADEVIR
jgi:putative ABC transport system substrate-binding protein